MYSTKTVRFNGSIPRNDAVDFVEAEIFTKPEIPFAIVRYRLNGKLQPEGLRLDLDKRVFLDHLEEASEEAVAASAAPAIVNHLFHLSVHGAASRRTAHF